MKSMNEHDEDAKAVAADEAAEKKAIRITELKSLLLKTDHKALSDYEPKRGEDASSIASSRKAWRDELRELVNS